MSVLTIVKGPDTPVLRAKNKTVPKVTKEIIKLIRDMAETMDSVNGAGLAAPQVGENVMVCIATINEKAVALINPVITWKSGEIVTDEEGCLSIPGVWVQVPRAREIVLTYMTPQGETEERKLADFNARVVQHEVDHLNGKLIVDYGT